MKLAVKLRKIVNKRNAEKENERGIINYITRLVEIKANRGESSYSYSRELEVIEIDWEYIKDYFYNEGFGVKLDDKALYLTW